MTDATTTPTRQDKALILVALLGAVAVAMDSTAAAATEIEALALDDVDPEVERVVNKLLLRSIKGVNDTIHALERWQAAKAQRSAAAAAATTTTKA